MNRILSAAAALIVLCAVPFAAPTGATAQETAQAKPTNTIKMTLTTGEVTIKLMPDVAPNHVKRAQQLVQDKFYENIVFHRVIPNFMAQSGDPTGTGTGGSKYPDLKAEFTKTVGFKAGTVGAARTADPDTANSQFFICHTDTSCRHLNGQYTIWGQVSKGMDAINKVNVGGTKDKILKAEFVK